MIKNKIYTNFSKTDKWDSLTFYSIHVIKKYKKKYLRLDSTTTREYGDHMYADWCYAYYPDVLSAPLDKILEWDDIYYGIEKYILNTHEYDLYKSGDLMTCEPKQCFKIVNEMVKGYNNQGCMYLPLRDVSIDTPCGYYFSED